MVMAYANNGASCVESELCMSGWRTTIFCLEFELLLSDCIWQLIASCQPPLWPGVQDGCKQYHPALVEFSRHTLTPYTYVVANSLRPGEPLILVICIPDQHQRHRQANPKAWIFKQEYIQLLKLCALNSFLKQCMYPSFQKFQELCLRIFQSII